MTDPSPTPRRVATPRWLDVRLVLGVGLVLAAVLVGAVVVSRAGDTEPVVSARHDLAAGTVLRSGDVAIARVKLPGGNRSAYLADLHSAIGRRLDRPVASGELLPAAAVTAVPAATTLTVPFAAGSAPALRAGQRIEVWVSTATCASVVLLADVTVQDVSRDTTGSFDTGSDGQDVVLSVDSAEAGRVIAALALDGAKIRAGILVGPAADGSTAPPADPAVSGQLPADLAACASPTAGR